MVRRAIYRAIASLEWYATLLCIMLFGDAWPAGAAGVVRRASGSASPGKFGFREPRHAWAPRAPGIWAPLAPANSGSESPGILGTACPGIFGLGEPRHIWARGAPAYLGSGSPGIVP